MASPYLVRLIVLHRAAGTTHFDIIIFELFSLSHCECFLVLV
jgi:hypothetical protein